MRGSSENLLARPPPRPLSAIVQGRAFLTGVLATAGSVGGLVLFLVVLATQVLPRHQTPILGDTGATLAVLTCIAGAALFVGAWVAAVSGWRRVHLYRTGQRGTGTVERVSVKGEGDVKNITIYWKLRAHDGRAHSMRTPMKLPRYMESPPDPQPGAQFPVLYPERRPGAAQPVGVLGLRRDWILSRPIQPPAGFHLARFLGIVIGLALLALALTGTTVNRTLDPGYLRSWTWIVAGSAGVLCIPFWLALRRWGPWLPGQPWVWIAGAFFVLCMGGLGMMSGANVWFDRSPPSTVRAQIMHMDDEYFPGWHFAAFVRSWRKGRVKERVPLYWRTALSVQPGDELLMEVRDGALGWPTVGRVWRAP